MAVVTDRNEGLFPLPREISFDCSCPDWALMCKHVAAVLYGVDEFYRPKVREEWDESEVWEWSRFEPLIEQADNGWRSNCLTMEKAR